MTGLLIALALLALLVCLAGWRFVHQLKRRQLASGLLWGTQGLLVLAGFIIVLLLYSNLHNYQRLTWEQPLVQVYLHRLKPQQYQLSIAFEDAGQEPQYFVLDGDQWQLDARILKWKGWANLIGLNSYYQLDRLSGRYRDVEQARQRPPSLHDLSPPARGLDVWKLKKLFKARMGFVDTLFGQSVFMPMADGAQYQLSIGQGGLLVRPVNEAAKAASL
jgi:hypothetical protein